MSLKLIWLLAFCVNLSFTPALADEIDSLLSLIDTTLVNEKQIKLNLKLAEHFKNKDIGQAIIHSKKALFLAEKLDSKKWKAESKLAIGTYYDYLGGNAGALEYLNQAKQSFEELGNFHKKVRTTRLIGNLYWYTSEFQLALNYYQEVLEFGETNKDTSMLIQGLVAKGAVYGNINKMDSAIILFKKAYKLSEKQNNQVMSLHSLFNLGDAYLHSNQPLKAITVFYQLEQNYDIERINSKLLAALYNSMSKAYLRLLDIKMAKIYNKKTRETLEKYPRLRQEKFFYLNSYAIDTLEKNYPSALKNYKKYKQISDSINDSRFKKQLANFEIFSDIERKERQIELLQRENKFKDLEIKQRRIINYGTGIFILLLFITIYQSYRASKRVKNKNKVLQEQKNRLEKANKTISEKSNELIEKNTELIEILERLKETQQQLVKSEKMASIGVLVSGIAHEINNPLNFISGGVIGLEQYFEKHKNENSKDVRMLLKSIDTGVQRASNIITSLNHFSRQSKSYDEIVNVNEVIDNCLVMLHNQLKQRVDVKVNYCKSNYTLLGNEGRIHQAILNILANANQSIKDKGVITIETELKKNKLEIKITDTGCGIKKENLSKITDPFFTTKSPGEGTGLGLAITLSIIEEHNGEIQFYSDINKGTEVLIQFPVKN